MASLVIELAGVIAVIIAAGFALAIFSLSLPPAEEKSRGLCGSAFGISGIETAFAVLYTKLVKTGEITLEQLVKALCDNPRKRFSLPRDKEDFTVFQVKTPYKINPDEFLSKGKSTPFDGEEVYGKCVLTVCGGKIVWQDDSTEN